MTTQRMLESPFGLRPTKRELKFSTLLSNLHDIAKDFDEELVANNDLASYHWVRGVKTPSPPLGLFQLHPTST